MAEQSRFRVDVVTPESIVFSDEATFVLARTAEGDIGILADHEPTMAALATGVAEIHQLDGSVVTVGTHGGFLQIFQNTVTLLTDRAEISEGGRAEAMELAESLAADGDE